MLKLKTATSLADLEKVGQGHFDELEKYFLDDNSKTIWPTLPKLGTVVQDAKAKSCHKFG